MLNLDYKCMEYAQKISDSNIENDLRKALGVLQEDGVYAMFLWLESKEGKNIREILIKLLNESRITEYLLGDSNSFPNDNFAEFCKKLGEVAKDIDKLLFVKKLLERTLIYALYHAKVGEKNVEKS